MDRLTITGLVLVVVALLGGSLAKGAGLGALWNLAGFIIVVFGTIGAVFVQVGMNTFKRGMRMSRWIFTPPHLDRRVVVSKVVEWSGVARKQGLLGLESQIGKEADPFTRKGLQLLVDGSEPKVIRETLEVDIDSYASSDFQAAKVFEAAGVYAPTLGIIGAVLGLMSVMQNLSDPSKLGPGIAAAFTATIYGIALANCLFHPVSNKLKGIIIRRSGDRSMLVDGLIAIAEGENPRVIQSRLEGYLN